MNDGDEAGDALRLLAVLLWWAAAIAAAFATALLW